MDEASDESVHPMLASCDRGDLGLRQRRQNETIGNVDAKLIAAAASARVASKTGVDPVGRAYRCVLRDRAPRHPDIDEPSVLMPDRVDARAVPWYVGVGPVAKGVESAAPQRQKGVVQQLHIPAVANELSGSRH